MISVVYKHTNITRYNY